MFVIVAAIETHIDALAAADLDSVDADELGDTITALQRAERRIAAQRLRLIAEHDRRQAWKPDGARSQVEWLRERCGVAHGQAAAQVEVARRLEQLPRTARELADGTVDLGQARLAAQAVREVPAEARGELDRLVADNAPDTDTPGLRSLIAGWQHQLDQQLLIDRERRARERRSLDVTSRGPDGGALSGSVEQVGCELLLAALASVSAPKGADDQRTATQRRADGLIEIVQRAMAAGALPDSGGVKPHASVVVGLDTLQGRDGAEPATLDRTGPASAEAARRLLCDAAVSRIITRGRSQILDVGRAERTVTPAQRRALAVRDRGCVGCGAPAGWADAHHIRHWADGGATDLDNLGAALLDLPRRRAPPWRQHHPPRRPLHPHPIMPRAGRHEAAGAAGTLPTRRRQPSRRRDCRRSTASAGPAGSRPRERCRPTSERAPSAHDATDSARSARSRPGRRRHPTRARRADRRDTADSAGAAGP